MKKILAIILAMMLCAAMAAGCAQTNQGGNAPGGTDPVETDPVGTRPSIVRFSADGTPILDPQRIIDYVGVQTIYNLYDGLVYQVGDRQEPNLATSWDISPDGLEYTFNLKQGAKFHDGAEVKASDVVFTLNRYQTIGEGMSYLFQNVTECVAIDEYTVKLVLGEPQGAFIDTIWNLYVLNEKLVMANIIEDGTYGEFGDYGKDFLLSNDAGSGPYMATEMAHQDYFLATKFTDWHMGWEGRENAPEQFMAIMLTEPSTQYTMMANQELEITSPWFAPENYEALAELPGVEMFNHSRAVTQYIFFNVSKSPTDCIYYRKALSHLIDYENMIEHLFPESGRPVGPISRSVSGHTSDVEQYDFDINKAREYLAQSIYADTYQDMPIDCYLLGEVPQLERMFLSMQANLEEVGITMRINKGTWIGFQESILSPETAHHISSCNIGPAVNDAATYLQVLYASGTQGTFENPTWSSTPEFDARLAAATKITDKTERNRLAAETQQYIASELVATAPVADLTDRVAYQAGYLDWTPARRWKETGEIAYLPNGFAFFMPDIAIDLSS